MDAGARHIRFTGEKNWMEVTMEEEEKGKRKGCIERQQDIQDLKYPNLPAGHSRHGNKSRRRRRQSGFWRWLRGIRRQRDKPKGDSEEGLGSCVGALAELTLEEAMAEEPADAASPTADDGHLDKWTAWRLPQK
uniref:REV ORF n=2 Tax=Caprine arthritis encephalitis virus TaxID=11660 RepID=Q65931_CAEV|nr:unnamed protein product [Caprine arthritis encephalitis virus]